MDETPVLPLPDWVPDGARRYLAHTEAGLSIRELARSAGCHASTVLRQVRQIETRRDDPLVDAALSALAASHFRPRPGYAAGAPVPGASRKDIAAMSSVSRQPEPGSDAALLEREACRILRRLCESGAVLAVAEEMEKAVVVCDGDDAPGGRTAVVESQVAQAMALKGWIACAAPARISRYHITAAGRGALGRILASHENRARAESEHGFAEAQTPFGADHRSGEQSPGGSDTAHRRRARQIMSESPLTALARRRDRDGQPFLDAALVAAGERLREDFELAQMGPRVSQNWERFLTGGGRGGFAAGGGAGEGHAAARDRLARTLSELGPGLSDVALRCCCYLEGLETAEKRMGWSARSGKIVLRIALQRLRRYYDDLSGPDRMIG